MKAVVIIIIALTLSGCHFCHEELQMIMMGIPVVGFAFSYIMSKVKGLLHRIKPCECPHTTNGRKDETKSTSDILQSGHSED